jgi:hypothetical protein
VRDHRLADRRQVETAQPVLLVGCPSRSSPWWVCCSSPFFTEIRRGIDRYFVRMIPAEFCRRIEQAVAAYGVARRAVQLRQAVTLAIWHSPSSLLGRCWDEIGLDSYLLWSTLASTNLPAFGMKNARPRDAGRHHRRRARTTVAGATIFTRRPG